MDGDVVTGPWGLCPCGHLWLLHDVEGVDEDGDPLSPLCCVTDCDQAGCRRVQAERDAELARYPSPGRRSAGGSGARSISTIGRRRERSVAGRALGELGAGLTQVPGDEGADHLGPDPVAHDLAEPDPQGFGQGDGYAEAMPVFLLLSHRSHVRAWLAMTQRSSLALGFTKR